jgi:hypothetical protein
MGQINSHLEELGDLRFGALVFEMGCNSLFEPDDFAYPVIMEAYEQRQVVHNDAVQSFSDMMPRMRASGNETLWNSLHKHTLRGSTRRGL